MAGMFKPMILVWGTALMNDTDERDQLPSPLRDVFQKATQDSGGNTAAGFIAVLDELDHRMQDATGAIENNQEKFVALESWYKTANNRFKELPITVRDAVRGPIQQDLTALSAKVSQNARSGAERGAQGTEDAIQVLWEEATRYEERTHRITAFAKLWIPVGMFGGIVLGLLFGSMIIPTLPITWQWPCKIIGSEYRYSNDPNIKSTYCLIERE